MANFSKMKKPKPTDKLHPIKSDFIRAKHAHMAFVLRPSKEDAVSEPPSGMDSFQLYIGTRGSWTATLALIKV